MTSVEPQNNIQLIIEPESETFPYNLPYENTSWGKFYKSYKELNQGQLRKGLQKNGKYLSKSFKILKSCNPYDARSWLYHIFYKTEWDENKKSFRTPKIVYVVKDRRDWKYKNDSVMEKRKVIRTILLAYRQRSLKEHNEVVEFYKIRRDELKKEHRESRLKYGNEKVECPHCKAEVSKSNLSRHIKTNKTCKTIQNASS
jgi:hypothetical protein